MSIATLSTLDAIDTDKTQKAEQRRKADAALESQIETLNVKTAGDREAALKDYAEILREELPEKSLKRLRDIMDILRIETADVRYDLAAFRLRQDWALDFAGPSYRAACEAAKIAGDEYNRLRAEMSRSIGLTPAVTKNAAAPAGESTPATRLAEAEKKLSAARDAHHRYARARDTAGRRLAMLKQTNPRIFGDGLEVPDPERPFERPMGFDREYLTQKLKEGRSCRIADKDYYDADKLPSQLELDIAFIQHQVG